MNIRLPLPRRSVASQGRAIYRKKVRPIVYPGEKGNFAAIDVRSGDYEVDADSIACTARLRSRRPDALIWLERVGYQSAHAFGGLRPDDDD